MCVCVCARARVRTCVCVCGMGRGVGVGCQILGVEGSLIGMHHAGFVYDDVTYELLKAVSLLGMHHAGNNCSWEEPLEGTIVIGVRCRF